MSLELVFDIETNGLLDGKLGSTAKAADSDKLDGKDSTEFALAHSHSIGQLCKSLFLLCIFQTS